MIPEIAVILEELGGHILIFPYLSNVVGRYQMGSERFIFLTVYFCFSHCCSLELLMLKLVNKWTSGHKHCMWLCLMLTNVRIFCYCSLNPRKGERKLLFGRKYFSWLKTITWFFKRMNSFVEAKFESTLVLLWWNFCHLWSENLLYWGFFGIGFKWLILW